MKQQNEILVEGRADSKETELESSFVGFNFHCSKSVNTVFYCACLSLSC